MTPLPETNIPAPETAPAVCRAGEFQFAPRHTHLNGCVQSRALFWCKSGHGSFTVNGRKYPLDPQDLYVLPWNRRILYESGEREPMFTATVHLVPWVRPGSPWIANVPHEINEPLHNSPDRADVPWPGFDGPSRFHIEGNSTLGRLMDYTTHWFRESTRDETESRSIALLLVREVNRLLQTSAQTDERRPQELTRMLVYLDRCLQQVPTVERLASIIARSRSHVLKLFQRHLGVSAKTYIINRQMREARELLLSTTLPVSEIGRLCGLPDPYHFSKLFRRCVGVPPREFRAFGGMLPQTNAHSTHSPLPPQPTASPADAAQGKSQHGDHTNSP